MSRLIPLLSLYSKYKAPASLVKQTLETGEMANLARSKSNNLPKKI